MITDNFPNFIGFKCFSIHDNGQHAYIQTPFYFEDGRGVPVYVSLVGESQIKFHDGGDVVTHFEARCLMYNYKKTIITAIDTIAKKNSVTFACEQVLETCGPIEDSNRLFANFLAMMLELRNWELEFLESLERETLAV